MLNYIIYCIVPCMILYVILTNIIEKKDVLKLFIQGCLEGLKIVYNIFPYILAITIAVKLITSTNTLNIILYPFNEILQKIGIPKNVVPLFIVRPLSGGASTSVVMDIFKESGPDSISGKIASVLMGATETTFYTITILFGAIGIKKIRGTLVAGLVADFVAILMSIVIVCIFHMI